MATQEAESSPFFPVQMVANNFVETYYDTLLSTPRIVHKFYEDSSTITRPNLTGGEMSSVSTMQGINDKILSLEYHSSKVQIESIDAQESLKNGIIVLVTGFLIGEGEMKRSFTQTFFLAKHKTGYFVLNDIFKFGFVIDETVDTAVATEVIETIAAPLTKEKQESFQEPDQQAKVKPSGVTEAEVKPAEVKPSGVTESEVKPSEVKPSDLTHVVKPFEVKQSEVVAEKVNSNGLTKSLPSNKGSVEKEGPILKEVVVSKQLSISSEKQTQELPKMSYASMLAKVSPVASPVKRMTNPVVVVAPSANSYLDKKKPKPEQSQPNHVNNARAPPTNNAQAPHTNNAQATHMNNGPPSSEKFNDGKSIYVGHLPPRIPVEDLAKAFSKYGPIEKGRIQVIVARDNFCYAFVEFESSNAARKAVEDEVIWFGPYKSYMMEKKSTVQGSNSNTRQASVRGEYRNYDNNQRSRENSAEGRRDQNGYRGDYGQNRGPYNNRNQNQFQNRGTNDFSGQNRSRNGGGEQKVQQNGGTRQAAPMASAK